VRLIRDGLLAILSGVVIAIVVASTGPRNLLMVLWAALAATLFALALVLVADWKRAWIRGRLGVIGSHSPVVWRGFAARREIESPARLGHAGNSSSIRVALIAVRSELATCAIRIGDALDRSRWWHPNQELPASEWSGRFADLADPTIPPALHQEIERAYQQCGSLNERIRRYITEHKEAQPFAAALGTPASVYKFREGDEEALRRARKTIAATNSAITARVDEAQ